MQLMKDYDVPVPRSAVATTPDEAELAYSSKLGGGGSVMPFCMCWHGWGGVQGVLTPEIATQRQSVG